ncbi:MAG: PAS domain S-box protein [Phormidium sp.]
MVKPYQILMVIDDISNSEGYTRQLQRDETVTYQVLTKWHDTQILRVCQSQKIDGILLELSSSCDNRLNCLSQLKEKMGENCPPIVVIGSPDAEVAVQSFKKGATDYLIGEQMTPDDLRLTMGRAIENAGLRRELQCTQEQFQTSVENMLDCFGIFSSIRDESGEIVDFRIDYLNKAACENNQMPKEMQIGRGLCEVFPAHRESGLFNEYCQLVKTGKPLIKDSLIYEDSYGEQRLVRAYDIRASKLNDGFVASWRDVTDRKRLELQLNQTVAILEQQQNRLERLIDTAPIGIGIGSANGEVSIINDTMLALHGYTREEFEQQGMNWRDFTPKEFVDRIEPAMAQLREHGFLPPEQKELLRRDGSRVPIWISATQWRDDLDEHVAFAVDLKEHKQTEAILEESQQHYRELAQAMPQMVWTADATGSVNYWNQRWYEYSGLSEAESIGLAAASTIHPDERDRTLEQWSQCLSTGEPFEIEYRIRRWDGVYRWFISRGVPTRDNQGQITGWIGTITDIDEQKRLEAQLRLVLRAVNGLIFDWNLQTDEVYRSEKLFDLIGVRAGEDLPIADWWYQRIHPDDLARLRVNLPQLLANSNDLYEGEYRIRHEDGHWVNVWERGCLVRDPQGQVIRIVGSTVDITERKRAELDLREANIQLEAALAAGSIYTWRWNIPDNLVSGDRNFANLFGVNPEDAATGLPLEQFLKAIHPEDLEQVTTAIEQAIATGVGYAAQFRIRNAQGEERWLIARGRVESDAYGNAIAFPGALADITDRQQAELERKRSEAILQAFLAASPITMALFDRELRFLYANVALAKINELPLSEHLGKTLWEVVPQMAPQFAPMLQKIMETQEPVVNLEFNGEVRPGVFRSTIANHYPVCLPNGEVIGVGVAVMDLSNLTKAQQELRESEGRFRTLADNISQFAWMADETGYVFWYNQRWFDYTGTTLEEMQGWGWQRVHHPNHVERVVSKFRCSIERGSVWEDTFPLRGKDGQYRWFLSRAIPVRDEQGKVLRWFGTNTDITDLRQTELALRQTTERLNVALKSAPITLFNQDLDLRYTWIYNPTHNLSIEEVVGKRDEDLASPDSAAYLTQLKQQVLDSGQGLREEVKVTNNGQTYYYDLAIDPLWDSQNRIVGITCAAVDISQRKQTEETLAANEARLRGFVEANVVGILYGDIYGNINEANDELLRMVGYTREDLGSGKLRWIDITPPEHLPLDEQAIAQARAKGACTPYEKEYIRKDGSRVPVLVGYSLVGETREESVAFILDLSDRKLAEAALRQSEDRLRIAIASAQLGTWDWNLVTNELRWDAGCKAMFGLPPEAEISIEVFFAGVHPDDRARLEQVVELCLNRASSGNYDVEYRTIGIEDGIERWIKAKGQAYFDPAGKPLRFIGTVLDITEQKQVEVERERLLEQEQRAREAAERANRVKDEFLAILSHELRSPLNPILGWTKLLQSRKLDPARTAEALLTIERNVRLQTQLIDDLLDIARILRGKLSMEMAPVDLVFVIEAAIDTVKTAAVAKEILLHPVLPQIGQVCGDAVRLQQVVWNLLTNAIKFTPKNGRVEIRLERVGEGAQITVSDTGKGISPDFLPYIFESFRQEDATTTRKFGGLGLGLAIVRQLVEAHGGIVTADSAGQGQGATFTVNLPLMAESIAIAPNLPTKASLSLENLRVLVVDDEVDSLKLLEVFLPQEGAIVTAVSSAAQALQMVTQAEFDLLISDIGMPEMDGYSLIRQIRALPLPFKRDIPAIALTAYAGETNQSQALAAGFQTHLEKPIDPQQMLDAIASLIYKKSPRS